MSTATILRGRNQATLCLIALSVLIAWPLRDALAQTTFTVTVVPRNDHPNPQAYFEVFAINGVEGAVVTVQRGTTYTFQMQNVPAMHSFFLTTSSSGGPGTTAYSNGVTGNFANGNETLTFTPGASTPDLLYYQCSPHANMGWRIEVEGGATPVEPEDELSERTNLEQNYPNPFTPPTTIRFHLHQAGQVSLTIVDAAGREIRRLVNGHLATGMHEFEWDGTDASGRSVASGTYLYHLQTPTGSETKTMTLVR